MVGVRRTPRRADQVEVVPRRRPRRGSRPARRRRRRPRIRRVARHGAQNAEENCSSVARSPRCASYDVPASTDSTRRRRVDRWSRRALCRARLGTTPHPVRPAEPPVGEPRHAANRQRADDRDEQHPPTASMSSATSSDVRRHSAPRVERMRIVVLGAGAIGGTIGARLHQARVRRGAGRAGRARRGDPRARASPSPPRRSA